MIIDEMPDETIDFMELFGDALLRFLTESEMSEAEASRKCSMGRATFNTYTRGAKDKKSPTRKRRVAPAELLAKACILGFRFEYDGHTIVALKGGQPLPLTEPQLRLEFTRQFDLGENGGTVALGLKKPPGKIELSVSLKAVS
jgi:hypothetical protein